MTTGFIICGALGREVQQIINRYGWDADIIGVSAIHHLFPQRIAPAVEKRILAMKAQYARLIVVYGDCGTAGALDETLARYGIKRVAGLHCYEMYAGNLVNDLMAEELGTWFLTDFLVRKFEGTILKGMGLDRFPELKADYFRHYKRIVYLAQNPDEALQQKAQEIAAFLELPLEIRRTGLDLLEQQLLTLMEGSVRNF